MCLGFFFVFYGVCLLICPLSGVISRQASNGDCYCISRSVPYDDGVPGVPGCVRAEVEASGYLIQPAGSAESLVVYLAQARLGGRLAQRVTRKAMESRVDTLAALRAFMLTQPPDGNQ